ncbi:MAG: ACP phosphodiesterase [Cyclobacteriaceae bacterium]
MNFLAHLYLSGDNEQLQLGNFIGDFVKGNQVESFNKEIKEGIKLHRKIDDFTDTNEIVLRSKVRLRPKYRHYSPVIVDMYYDHFLAANWTEYAEIDLKKFTTDFYQLADKHKEALPHKVNEMLGHMSATDWLYNYQFIEGLDRALSGMARRTRFDSGMDRASRDLQDQYGAFKKEFTEFFPLLIEFVNQEINDLS